jgi:hypothetical protein
MLPELHSTGLCPSVAPPPTAPTGARSNPLKSINSSTEKDGQDEAKLRSTTLSLSLSFKQNWLIYAT